MNGLLLVTGSRCFEQIEHASAKRRAQQHLHAVFEALPVTTTTISGAAVGPDVWAFNLAFEFHRVHTNYEPTGTTLLLTRTRKVTLLERWREMEYAPKREDFLRRDRYMVDVLSAWRDEGRGPVGCLAYIHENSRTQGTAYTAKYAESNNIPLVVLRYSLDSSPSVEDQVLQQFLKGFTNECELLRRHCCRGNHTRKSTTN
jgi:hypothetical protein